MRENIDLHFDLPGLTGITNWFFPQVLVLTYYTMVIYYMDTYGILQVLPLVLKEQLLCHNRLPGQTARE
jgi:hypothetical protein